jgi:hypothetical protein
MLLEYSRIAEDHLKDGCLTNALKELKESLAAHKTFDSLKSREQYYEFISALYTTSCVLESIIKRGKHEIANYLPISGEHFFWDLKSIAMNLFHHYCLNQKSIIHYDSTKTEINTALKVLQLPSYSEIEFYSGTTATVPLLFYSPTAVKIPDIEPGEFKLGGLV